MSKSMKFVGADYPLSTVPDSAKRPLSNTLMIWLGFAFFPGAVLATISIAVNFSVSELTYIIITSGIILGVLSAVSGLIGQQMGATYGLITRYAFGSKGMYLPSLWIPLALLGWNSINIASGSLMLTAMFDIQDYYWLITLICGILFVTTALGGLRLLSILSLIAVPFIAIIIGIMAIIAIKGAGGWSAVVAIKPLYSMTKAQAITSIVGMFAVGAGACSMDIQRFCKTAKQAVLTGILAFAIGFVYLIFLGGLAGLATGQDTLEGLFLITGMLIPGGLAILLLAWTTVDNDYYSASLGLSNAFKWERHKSTIVVASIALILALARSYLFIIPYLGLMSTIAVPLAGILASDYFLVNKREYPPVESMVDEKEIEKYVPKVRYSAYIGWILGALTVWYTSEHGLGVPPIQGWVVAFIVHYLGCLVEGKYPLNKQTKEQENTLPI